MVDTQERPIISTANQSVEFAYKPIKNGRFILSGKLWVPTNDCIGKYTSPEISMTLGSHEAAACHIGVRPAEQDTTFVDWLFCTRPNHRGKGYALGLGMQAEEATVRLMEETPECFAPNVRVVLEDYGRLRLNELGIEGKDSLSEKLARLLAFEPCGERKLTYLDTREGKTTIYIPVYTKSIR
ncbi:MAG: hypothetical protein NUV52_04085 [Candidatus Roizmanbacteria bacterium]|nr:hypothetical protein [Candidatus Roizmanbacteria bacterium]